MTEIKLNTMVDDINALSEALINAGLADRAFRGVLPKTYVDNTVAVRILDVGNAQRTNVHYRQNRTYQVVLFGANTIHMLDRIERTMTLLGEGLKLEVDGGYLTSDNGISFSEVFLTEDERLYASIGVLEAYVERQRYVKPHETIKEIHVNAEEEAQG